MRGRSDREFEGWEATRNAVPASCRRCKSATAIAMEGYDEIMSLRLPVDEATRIIELRIRSKCATGLIGLSEVAVCGETLPARTGTTEEIA